ncbi:LysR family transcriptional regulator [Nocardioides caldifontis]|uniref:LysR family transcriptional regulator n=1 Tax=Nocardioides caldifontis TaxID=2588938 RepID=UPI0011DFCC8A|nr:LysR family transcriptional regulator [Nocardioides caldifontis]
MARADVEGLRLLLTVREAGSIAAAAARLGVTQPAASSRLRALENRLGLTLVVRRPAGSHLTEAGHALCGWAEPVFEALHQVELGIDALVADAGSDMTVSASRTVAEHLLPTWISRLRRRRPDLSLQLSVTNSRGVLEAVNGGSAQIGFIETPLPPPREVASRIVGWDDLVVVAPRSHPWARRRRSVTAEELGREPLVVREAGSGTRETLERYVGAPVTAVAMQADSTSAIVGAVLGGLAPAAVPRRAVVDELAATRLVEVPLDTTLRRPFRAVWRRGERLRAPATDLLECAVE